jgi:mono/diheme cytochrome c family protein
MPGTTRTDNSRRSSWGTLNIPGSTMPLFQGILTEAEVVGIIHYVKTGWYQDQIEGQR